MHCDDRENSWLTNLEIMSGHSVTNFENRCVRKDGAVVDVLWSAYWSESDGTILQVARDITERKQAQATLQKTNRQLASALQANQLIIDNSQDVICTLDAKGQFLSTNAACQSLWGYKPEELIGRCYLVLVRPEDRVLTKQMEDRTRNGKQGHRFRESVCAQGRVNCRCALVGELVRGRTEFCFVSHTMRLKASGSKRHSGKRKKLPIERTAPKASFFRE